LFGRNTPADDRKAEQYQRWLLQRDPLAIASLVLGIFSLIEFGALLIFGIAGIVLGALSIRRLKRGRAAAPLGLRLAWCGILTSVASLVIAAVFVYRWI
jgi:hypothetical protein